MQLFQFAVFTCLFCAACLGIYLRYSGNETLLVNIRSSSALIPQVRHRSAQLNEEIFKEVLSLAPSATRTDANMLVNTAADVPSRKFSSTLKDDSVRQNSSLEESKEDALGLPSYTLEIDFSLDGKIDCNFAVCYARSVVLKQGSF
jgi:hypothetical protein